MFNIKGNISKSWLNYSRQNIKAKNAQQENFKLIITLLRK